MINSIKTTGSKTIEEEFKQYGPPYSTNWKQSFWGLILLNRTGTYRTLHSLFGNFLCCGCFGHFHLRHLHSLWGFLVRTSIHFPITVTREVQCGGSRTWYLHSTWPEEIYFTACINPIEIVTCGSCQPLELSACYTPSPRTPRTAACSSSPRTSSCILHFVWQDTTFLFPWLTSEF